MSNTVKTNQFGRLTDTTSVDRILLNQSTGIQSMNIQPNLTKSTSRLYDDKSRRYENELLDTIANLKVELYAYEKILDDLEQFKLIKRSNENYEISKLEHDETPLDRYVKTEIENLPFAELISINYENGIVKIIIEVDQELTLKQRLEFSRFKIPIYQFMPINSVNLVKQIKS